MPKKLKDQDGKVQAEMEKLRNRAKTMILAGLLVPKEIARELACSVQFVNGVRMELEKGGVIQPPSLGDPLVSNNIESSLVRKIIPAIRRIGSKQTLLDRSGNVVRVEQSAVDFKNRCQGVGILIEKARLLADKSTSNVSSRSLAVAVSRRGRRGVPVIEGEVIGEGRVVEGDTSSDTLSNTSSNTRGTKPKKSRGVKRDTSADEARVVQCDISAGQARESRGAGGREWV